MNRFRSSLRMGLALFAAAVMVSIAACGTGVGGSTPPASGASTPATSHFNADLTAGFLAIEAVREGTLAAITSGSLSKDKGRAIQTQCTALTATLKSLKALGDTPSSEDAVAQQILAIQSFAALAALEGVKFK